MADSSTCRRCDYDLRTLGAQGWCPECGLRFDRNAPGEGAVRERRRRLLNRIDRVFAGCVFILLLMFAAVAILSSVL